MEQNNNSGVNTVLIVIVLLVLVGFAVWWFTARSGSTPANTPDQNGVNVDVTLPAGEGNQPAPYE